MNISGPYCNVPAFQPKNRIHSVSENRFQDDQNVTQLLFWEEKKERKKERKKEKNTR